jgi:hypothetical protein
MKKLIGLIALLTLIWAGATAQVATYSATTANITETGEWDKDKALDLRGKGVFIVYDIGENIIKVSNKVSSIYVIKDGYYLRDQVDNDGDVMKILRLNCWDQDGDQCRINMYYWENGVYTFSDGSDMVIHIGYENFIVEYRCTTVNFADR